MLLPWFRAQFLLTNAVISDIINKRWCAVLSEIIKDCFLHFLDRELLETQGVYDRSVENNIIRDVRFILFSSLGDLILSASFLFESKYAYAIYNKFKPLFFDGKFELAITYDSLKKMISEKQDQYKGKEKLFPNYFNNLWHMIEEHGIILIPKRQHTTLYIADGMLDISNYEGRIKNKKDIPYIMELVEDRGRQAITHHLFDPLYTRRDISTYDQETVNSLITELYIRSYMEYFDATIATGLSCGVYKYDCLATNYPYSDVTFWMKLYKKIGLFHFICGCNVETILDIIHSDTQYSFIRTVLSWLSLIKDETSGNILTSWNFYKYINSIPRFSELTIEDINLYFERLRKVEDILLHQRIIERRSDFMPSKEKSVFVVHGRNIEIKKSLFAFLRSLNLYPLEWESAVSLTGKGAPTTLEIITSGMKNSGGTIVLFTGDDLAKLREELCYIGEHYDLEAQPRQNVLFEAGMAFALHPESTVIVHVGKLREISDLAGINYINLSNSPEHRNALIVRLKTIGLAVDTNGSDWISTGNFDV